MQELANFSRESCSQFLRFAARSDRFTDAHHGLIAVAVALRRNDRVCTHSLTIQKLAAEGRDLIHPKYPNR